MIIILVLGLASAVFSAVNILCSKYLVERYRLNPVLASCSINVAIGLPGFILLPFSNHVITLPAFAFVIAGCLLFFIGNIALFFAFSKEDVSLVGPIINFKILFLALISLLSGNEAYPFQTGAGAVVAFAGLMFLSSHARSLLPRRISKGVLAVLLAALLWAQCDIIMKKALDLKCDSWFLANLFVVIVGFLSAIILILKKTGREHALGIFHQGKLLRDVSIASFSAYLSMPLFFLCFSLSKSAVISNVLLSMRGLLIIIPMFLLTLLGRNALENNTSSIYGKRLTGGIMMTLAVCLVLWR